MSLKGYKPSTVVSYIAGISYHLKLNGLADFTEVFIVRKMLKGLQRSQPSKDIRAPVTIDMLKAFPPALYCGGERINCCTVGPLIGENA